MFNHVGSPMNEYVYAADGRKLQVTHKAGSSVKKKTDYIGNMVYENGILKRILIEGGYIEDGAYYFYLTDHLGNVRVVADEQGTDRQVTHYYPFGSAFMDGKSPGLQPYKYNGKEQDKMHGLNLYDYHARHYDPPLGRFTTIDPLAEKYYNISPYVYVANNPMKFIDPDGKRIDDYFDFKGKYLGTDNAVTDFIRIMDENQWNMLSENGVINPELGTHIGQLHSEASLSKSASLSIYEHYNPTGLSLADAKLGQFGEGTGMEVKFKDGKLSNLDVDIEGFSRSGIADHFSEVKNLFIHENKHVTDFKEWGYDKFKNNFKRYY